MEYPDIIIIIIIIIIITIRKWKKDTVNTSKFIIQISIT
jgi:hypothetical protein